MKTIYTSKDLVVSSGSDIVSKTWLLTAGETDAQSRMPITLIASRAIEIATEHANYLGIGYSELAEHRLGWVLARLTIEMVRYPEINESYTMSTWIEGYNRFMCDRGHEMTDAEGHTVANIRSVWVAIDMNTRAMADLTKFDCKRFPIADRTSPAGKCRTPSVAKNADKAEAEYTFKYCDIDFNRHVNTIRYLDLVLNQRPLDFYDHNLISRLEVTFDHECYFGETVRLITGPDSRDPLSSVTEIHTPNHRAAAVKLTFGNR